MDTDQKILEKFIMGHPGSVLILIENLNDREMADFLQSLPDNCTSYLLSQMDRFKAAQSLKLLGQDKSIELIDKMTMTEAETLLRSVDKNFREEILRGLPSSTSQGLKRVLRYPKNVVGAYLDPTTFTLSDDLTVHQARKRLKQSHPSILSHIFVLSKGNHLKGFIEITALITCESSQQIKSVMKNNPPGIIADMDISVLIEGKGWREPFSCLPVIDTEGVFLGSISRNSFPQTSLEKKSIDSQTLQASRALGDLYQIGLASLLRSSDQISLKSQSK